MSKNCIISFANSRSNYIKSLARLGESLRNNFDGDFLGFIGEAALGAPLHSEVPYGFKVYAFNVARNAGFQNVLWLDSSCFAIKNVQPCFDEIERDGFLFQNSGHTANNWMNDSTLEYFNLTREQARDIRLIGNAGMLGLNFSMKLPNDFFDKWEQAMVDGMFEGKWDNKEKTESLSEECFGHRHDMLSGIILYQMGVDHLMKDGDKWLQYATEFQETANDTIIFKAAGM